jgi:hypothetical protein
VLGSGDSLALQARLFLRDGRQHMRHEVGHGAALPHPVHRDAERRELLPAAHLLDHPAPQPVERGHDDHGGVAGLPQPSSLPQQHSPGRAREPKSPA